MALALGTRIGPYEVLALLGAGGMGEVYRARDTRLDRDMALKVLPPEFSADGDRRRRFEQEARAASALNHPHVVQVYDIGTSDSTYYIAMELVEGRTLRAVLEAGPLPTKKILDLAVQAADALAKAHGAGIVHRDLKPENLIVSKEGHVKILDFGLAKVAAAQTGDAGERSTATDLATGSGVILGTVGYMSPEQAAGQPVDFRSDQFSLGAILYEMASGQRAFRRKTGAETLTAILREQPEPLARLNPRLPTALRWLIEERCLAKDAEERYASTRDLLRELKAVRDHISDVPAPDLSATSARTARRRVSLPAAVGLAALAMGVGLLAGQRAGKSPPRTVPSFHRLTFRRGTVSSARFAPDGQTIVYGAAWDGARIEAFQTRRESPASRALGLPAADILAVSSSGEMAILLDRRFVREWTYAGTLARVPLVGGAPRPVLDEVQWADWSPNGESLALVRDVGGKNRLEYPIGNVLCETAGWISHPRVSPRGDLLAFLEHPTLDDDRGFVAIMDLMGKKRSLSGEWGSAQGLVWSVSGDEIWFTASESGWNRGLHAVTLSGSHRLVDQVPGGLTLNDISRDGGVLLSRDNLTNGIFGLPPGEMKERDLSALDYSIPADLSADGRTVLIYEGGAGAGPNYGVYLRRTNSTSPATLLGEGTALALSPDGKWALAFLPSSPKQLMLLPTGPGEAKRLPDIGLHCQNAATWFPDGKRILYVANESGKAARAYVQDLEGGKPRAITPEGVRCPFATHTLSRDGTLVAAVGLDGNGYIYPVDGGEPRPIPGWVKGDVPIAWGVQNRLYVFQRGVLPAQVHRLDVSTGRRELWKEINPPDPAGLVEVREVMPTPDGRAYVYDWLRILSELYLAEGLK